MSLAATLGLAAKARPAAHHGGRLAPFAVGAAVAALIVAGFLLAFWGRPINHDTAWYLIATRDWLAGARLYADIYEVNPPLNFYYTVPAVLLSDALGITDTNVQVLVTAGVTFASLFWCWTILRQRMRLGLPRQALFLAGLGAATILPATRDIAQREHLLVLLLLPWLLGQLPGSAPERGAKPVARAAVAALGICLKPFFLLFPIFVTLWLIRRDRSLRPVLSPSNLTMVVTGLAYVGAVLLLHPEYFTEIIPVARTVYGAIGAASDQVLLRFGIPAAPFLVAALVAATSRSAPPATGLFVAAALAGLGSYLWQWTGFPYHLIPFESFAAIACLWLLAHARKISAPACAGALALAAIAALWLLRGPYDTTLLDSLRDALGPEDRPRSVFVASTDVSAGPPLAAALGADWASRYPHAWLLPGVLNGLRATDCNAEPVRCARLEDLAQKTRDDNLADLAAHRPDVLVVDNHSGFISDPDFSWYDFMAAAPEWESVLAGYRLTNATPRFDIWKRCAAPGPTCG